MRLAGIKDLESANRFLDGKYLQAFNRQFAREAASPVDVHRAAPRNLNEVLSWEAERVVDVFQSLNKSQKQDLLNFLRSL